METSILQGKLIRLDALDIERDAPTMARWSQDAEYMRTQDCSMPARPTSLECCKENFTAWYGQGLPSPTFFAFAVRTLAENRLIGLLELEIGPAWPNREAWLGIGIGEAEFRSRGYGSDTMQVALRYAFTELGLHRISLNVSEYNARAVQTYLKAGFTVEGRARAALARDGRRWDLIYMGILHHEWKQAQLNNSPGKGR